MSRGRRVIVIIACALGMAYAGVQAIIWLMNSPIAYHGRVVDEAGHPCAGATVSAMITRRRLYVPVPALWVPDNNTSSRKFTVTTDENGAFAIYGRGVSFAILRIHTRDGRSAGGEVGHEAPYSSNP